MTDRIINISIYFTYLVIASVSVVISYKVSLVMSLIVLAIECVRMMGIYKKAYAVILLVFILNTFLIGYNSYKSQSLIEYNNAQIIKNNNKTESYLQDKQTILSANKFKDLKSEIKELENISVDWWLLVGVYIILELSLILLIIKINKEEKKIVKPKVIKKTNMQSSNSRSASSYLAKQSEAKLNGKNLKNKEDSELKITEEKQEITTNNKAGEFIGSARDYAKDNGLSVRDAEKELKELKAKGLLVKRDGKNYLIREAN